MAETDLAAETDRLRKRLNRERLARLEAEALAETKVRELYHRQQELELLSVIAEASNSADSVEATLQIAVDRICKYTGWPIGYVQLAKADAPTGLAPTRIWHLTDAPRFVAFREAIERRHLVLAEELGARIQARRECLWVEDVAAADDLSPLALAVPGGVRSAFGLPVIVREQVAAVLEFFSDEPTAPNPAWLAVAQRVGVQLSRVFERKQTELAMQVAMDAAEAGNRAKSEFLATMSHEIRTPMNGIMGFTNLLLDGTLSAQQREFVELIHSSGQSLLTIINDILDFSKIEADKLVLEQEPFHLTAVVEEVADLLSQEAEAKGLEVVLRFEESAYPAVIGDMGRVRQILLNLLSNAIKFTPEGHVLIELSATPPAADGGRCYKIAVSDSGIGIAPEKQAELFQKFTQADASTTRRFGGTGLGLAISKRLAERMGGQIGLTSAVNRGSTFWFTLPATPAGAAAAEPVSPAALQEVKVLIIDDLALNRRVLEEQCKTWLLDHDTASSGAMALAKLRAAVAAGSPYRVALVDYLMPDMDGESLGREILRDPALRATALIMLTSGSQRGDARRLLAVGFAGFLIKPVVRPVQLLDAIARAARVSLTVAAPVAHKTLLDRGASAASARAASARHRVLLAEDNQVNRRLAVHMLERLNCRVDVAADGQEAVELAQRFPYDIIFMDCQMPRLDGFEATAEIRRREGSSAPVPIVAVTANAMAGDREKCLAAGMSDYVSKPLELEELRRTLRQWTKLGPAQAPAA